MNLDAVSVHQVQKINISWIVRCLKVNSLSRKNFWGFKHNRSATNQIFYIHQILEKNWKCNRKAYDSVSTEVMKNILIEFGIPVKLARLIKMCLNEKQVKFV
jgi:hypothetical protein